MQGYFYLRLSYTKNVFLVDKQPRNNNLLKDETFRLCIILVLETIINSTNRMKTYLYLFCLQKILIISWKIDNIC